MGNTSYAAIADVTARYPNRDLVQLTNEDPTVETVNATALQAALNDAGAEIDLYITSRFQQPLATVPVGLTIMCCDIAVYNLQRLRPLKSMESARQRYEDAIAKLRLIAKGELTLGLDTSSNEPVPAQERAVVLQDAPPPMFSRHRLRVY